jgi:predicted nucleic-acid-binding protein
VTITVDTNVLVRIVVRDDLSQAGTAEESLRKATSVVIAVPSFCEFAWVLRSAYGLSNGEIALAIQAFLDVSNVVTNRPVVEAGVAFLLAGGDFADGTIAYEGSWMGGETFVSFDRKAVALATAKGYPAQLLS